MSRLIAVTAIVLQIAPFMCHRLITNPYPDQEWDSVIVSSDPIKIKERKDNAISSKRVVKPQKRSYEECPENDFKCLYGNDEDKDINQIVDKFVAQYSEAADAKLDERNETEESESSRKSYWTMVDSQTHHHPYDDKKGWITLDPVPWSTSKISKWHPNRLGNQPDNKPWSYGSTQRPVQQFWVSGSSLHTQRPTTQWGIGSNDIITDNRPGDFPTENQNGYGYSHQQQGFHQENGYYGYQGSYQNVNQNQGYKGNEPSRFPSGSHPSTYPSSGNGEWILLSTTKGYSVPQRHRWSGKTEPPRIQERARKIKLTDISKYHEEELSDMFELAGENHTGNRKSDENVTTESSVQKVNTTEEKTPEVLYTGPPKSEKPVKIIRRKVRLQVLPSPEKSTTSHGGLLEVDSSPQTVDEAQQEDEKLKKLQTIANIKKGKIRGYKLVPVNKSTGKGINHKSALAVAAVGAGMIPATMALLVPMALGRKKRSVNTNQIAFNKNFDNVQNQKIRW